MRLGIDIDDTITNTYECLIEAVAKHYEIDSNELLNRNLGYDAFYDNEEEFPCFTSFAENNFCFLAPNYPLKKDALKYLNKLHDEGNEIVFITARHFGEYDNPYDMTYNYLIKNDVPFDNLIVGTLDKGRICMEENIDLFIDDSVNNCTKVKQTGVNTLLFDARYNKNSDLRRVYDWQEVYDLIHNHKI